MCRTGRSTDTESGFLVVRGWGRSMGERESYGAEVSFLSAILVRDTDELRQTPGDGK